MVFSIIVPIFNVEEYLKQCINSILSQSSVDFELILVDDGSPDNCPHICDEYEKKDIRVHVIHKKNGGLSSARNAGIKIASGDYIIFFDSDDVMEEGALKEIANKLTDSPDVLVTEIYNTNSIENRHYPQNLFDPPLDNDKQTVIEFVFSKKPNTWASVQYIVKKELIINNNLQFDLGFFHEDVSWTARLFACANSFEYYNNIWYIRRLGREGSITTVVNPKRTIDMLTLTGEQTENSVFNSLNSEERRIVFNQMARAAFSSLIHYKEYSKEDKKKVSLSIKDNMNVFRYATSTRHKLFVHLMQVVGPDVALKIYCALLRH